MKRHVQMDKKRTVSRRALMGALGLLMLGTGCGLGPNVVIVNVQGLEPAIRELRVSLLLDGTPARNPAPSTDSPEPLAFAVFRDMRRFAVEVPTGTRQLGIAIEGLNTSRSTVRTGMETLELGTQQEVTVLLQSTR
jgi:hypothetical protein